MAATAPRTRVFVSYSHRDRKWVERLKVHLKPLVRDRAIALWDDSQIPEGADWGSAIARELSLAEVAILLISADYFASDFIAVRELPSLLRAAQEDGAKILMLIVSPSSFAQSPLAAFQAVNEPSEPLIGMKKPQREDTFVRLAAAVHRAAGASSLAGQASAPQPTRADGRREPLDVGGILRAARDATLLYDSDGEPEPFTGWMLNAHRGATALRYSADRDGSFTMRATGTEVVGINKSLPVLTGSITFEYQIAEPSVPGWHVYFAMIPMQQSQGGLLEMGAAFPADPHNVRSPYRLRVFVPGEYYGDGEWHAGRMTFCFEGLPTASYSIFAARINEGVDEPNPATVRLRSVRAWTI